MALDPTACLIMEDDLLDFSLVGEDEEDDKTKAPSSSLDYSNPNTQYPDDSFPEFAEEELEWLSNKDAFPSVETCLDILPNPQSVVIPDHQSPISVLENSTSSSNSNITNCCSGFQIREKCPARARSKLNRKKRKEFPEFLHAQLCWLKAPPRPLKAASSSAVIGRRCQHCLADKTPQWRAGPMGPKTLCNACGVRYKSGRLVPEYRPANSPTFSSVMHSNSHRKIMEMRRHKYVGGGMVVNGGCGYGVGG